MSLSKEEKKNTAKIKKLIRSRNFTNIETGEGKSCSVEYFNQMQKIGNIKIVEL